MYPMSDPGSPPSLSSSCGAPAGAPPPQLGGRVPVWTEVCGAADVSGRPGVCVEKDQKVKGQKASQGLESPCASGFITRITFNSRMADFLFSLLWSCREDLVNNLKYDI